MVCLHADNHSSEEKMRKKSGRVRLMVVNVTGQATWRGREDVRARFHPAQYGGGFTITTKAAMIARLEIIDDLAFSMLGI